MQTSRLFKKNWTLPIRLNSTVPGPKKTTKFLAGKSVLESGQFTRDNLDELCDIAGYMKRLVEKQGITDICKGLYSANLFYEPSTRTNSSFHTAMGRLGGEVLPIHTEFSSVKKGETIEDTIRVVQQYVDIVIMRHPDIGSVARAAKVADIPIINAGDGANEHPTQALLDLFCIQSHHGKIDGLTIAMVGDLKYGRTVHSLSKLLEHFNVQLLLISPPELEMPDSVLAKLTKNGTKFTQCTDFAKAIPQADVIYMTRVQKERFPILADYMRVKDAYIMDEAHMQLGKPTMTLMHPLPRINEITVGVDADPRAKYFEQVRCGMFMRMAILAAALGRI